MKSRPTTRSYGDLAVVPAPVGKSGVIGKGLMGMSVKADTKFPNASMALAQFFTNARALTAELSKQSAVYPSSKKAFDDPYFSAESTPIEDSARGSAEEAISTYADIVPTTPTRVRSTPSYSRPSRRPRSVGFPPSRP